MRSKTKKMAGNNRECLVEMNLDIKLDIKREEILSKAIPFILEYGWCERSLCESSSAIGKDQYYWETLFFNIESAVEFFQNMEDRRAIESVTKLGEIEGVRPKIAKALRERLVAISGGVLMLAKLEKFYCKQGSHIPSAMKTTWKTADIIWIFAGDKSTDFNYYSKRLLLSGIYTATVKRLVKYGVNGIDEYIYDLLSKAIKFGKLKEYLKPENIPILRMFT